MNLYALSALVNLFTSIVLGALLLLTNRKSMINQWFAGFAIAIAVWSCGYFFWQISNTADMALFWLHILMTGAIFIAPLYFHFVTLFLGRATRHRVAICLGYIFTVFFSFINWVPSIFIAGVHPISVFLFWPLPGTFFWPFLTIWIIYVIYAEALLLWSVFQSRYKGMRSQINYVLIGTTIGYIGGATNYFLWFNILIPPYGNILVTAYVICVAYAIVRHQLFNIKALASEFLIFSLWLFIFVRLLLAETSGDQIAEGGLLLVSLVVGVLLIRSIENEVEQREKIEKLSAEKSEFMSFASHEIRNPITAMRGLASLIVDGTAGEVSPKVKEIAQKILISGDSVLTLINQFLNKSKLELAQISYQIADFDAERVVSNAVDSFRIHAQEKGLSLEKHIDFPHLVVRGDEAKLREALGNLIDNSIKYTNSGHVTVSLEKRNGMARIAVADTGVGIAHDVLPNLFQKFSRADSQDMNLLGSGLGLFLAKTFVDGMGGKIWAESEGAGRGSRFFIELHVV